MINRDVLLLLGGRGGEGGLTGHRRVPGAGVNLAALISGIPDPPKIRVIVRKRPLNKKVAGQGAMRDWAGGIRAPKVGVPQANCLSCMTLPGAHLLPPAGGGAR